MTFVGIALLSMSKHTSEIEQKTSEYRLGLLLGLLSATLIASITILSRTLKSVDTLCLSFAHSTIGTFVASVIILLAPHEGSLFSFE